MITIRVPLIEEEKNIKELLSKYELNYKGISKNLHNSMVVFNGEKIIGYGSYIPVEIKKKHIGIIEIILIRKEFRNQYIGEGLVKSLLNLANNNGINKIYSLASKKEEAMFYKKLGFIKRNNLDEGLLKRIFYEGIYVSEEIEVFEAKLPDFFNKACKSSSL